VGQGARGALPAQRHARPRAAHVHQRGRGHDGAASFLFSVASARLSSSGSCGASSGWGCWPRSAPP
jgi:hypothetical protein